MVFSTTNLFKGIDCPAGNACDLTHCIYRHDSKATSGNSPAEKVTSQDGLANRSPKEAKQETPAATLKRKRPVYDTLDDKPVSRADTIRAQIAATRTPKDTGVAQTIGKPLDDQNVTLRSVGIPQTVGRAVTPPEVKTRANGARNESSNASIDSRTPDTSKVNLNPRLIPNDPAGHAKRSLFLKHLHTELAGLKTRYREDVELKRRLGRAITDQDIVLIAVNEEEQIAREKPTVYANVLKQRIMAFKKMTTDEWIELLIKHLARKKIDPGRQSNEKAIDTGLPLTDECAILPQLVIEDQRTLAQFGYIPTPPTAEAAAEAAAAVEASHNYETCERCMAHFQVYPDRDEDGRLSSNGPCVYHPRRKVWPARSKADWETGPREPYYPCCGEPVGTPGCTRSDEHVFKTSSPARLAAVLPFLTTPENANPSKDSHGREIRAVTFDCEMGYTAFGLELIRLTAISWPYNEKLIDVLVRPLGQVIDFNSRFSGVYPEHFAQAIPHEKWKAEPDKFTALPYVENPQTARSLLCSYISPGTPLLGHAIDNDLNAVRLCHPTVIDTVLLYPVGRGLPLRPALKMLAQKHLGRYIQMGGDAGHDSMEDALATGDLVRVRVGEYWKYLKAKGWKIVDGKLWHPTDELKKVDIKSSV